jgi:hypothetical protein
MKNVKFLFVMLVVLFLAVASIAGNTYIPSIIKILYKDSIGQYYTIQNQKIIYFYSIDDVNTKLKNGWILK